MTLSSLPSVSKPSEPIISTKTLSKGLSVVVASSSFTLTLPMFSRPFIKSTSSNFFPVIWTISPVSGPSSGSILVSTGDLSAPITKYEFLTVLLSSTCSSILPLGFFIYCKLYLIG